MTTIVRAMRSVGDGSDLRQLPTVNDTTALSMTPIHRCLCCQLHILPVVR